MTVPLSPAVVEGTWWVVAVVVLLVSQGMGAAMAWGARAVKTRSPVPGSSEESGASLHNHHEGRTTLRTGPTTGALTPQLFDMDHAAVPRSDSRSRRQTTPVLASTARHLMPLSTRQRTASIVCRWQQPSGGPPRPAIPALAADPAPVPTPHRSCRSRTAVGALAGQPHSRTDGRDSHTQEWTQWTRQPRPRDTSTTGPLASRWTRQPRATKRPFLHALPAHKSPDPAPRSKLIDHATG